MSEHEYEPPPTSIQAGAPSQTGPPVDDDEAIDIGVQTPFDRFLAAIKAHERWGLAIGVAVQALVLGGMIALGAAKALGL